MKRPAVDSAEPWQQDGRLADTLRVLFPEPTTLSTPRRGQRAQVGSIDYVVLPSLRHPKLMLPVRPGRVTASGVRNYRPYASRSDRIKRLVLSGAIRTGIGLAWCDRVRVTRVSGATIDGYLASALGRPSFLGLHIGPSRAVQKPVLQLMSESGKTFAFAKIGDTDFARELVLAETESINFLSSIEWRYLRVPRVLHGGTWQGHAILVQEALVGHGSSVVDAATLAEAMNELARCRNVVIEPLGSSEFWTMLRRRLECLPGSAVRDQIRRAVEDINQAHGNDRIEFGSWHGDWTPWNMTTDGSRALVWDWEKFADDVPIGFDAVHYDVQGAVVGSKLRPAQAFAETRRRSGSLLGPFGANSSRCSLIVTLYALALVTRYLQDGETDAGTTPMTRVAEWLPIVLRDSDDRPPG